MTNGTLRSEIIKEQTIRRLKEHGYCFEGERFPVNTPPDTRYAPAKAAK
jgi:hypothetical protein